MNPLSFQSLQSLVNHSFYFMAGMLYLGLHIAAAQIVAKSKWSVHLNWIKYFIGDSVLALIYTTIYNAHYFTGVHLPATVYTFARCCLYMANIVGLVGTVILCRTLNQMVIEEKKEAVDSSAGSDVLPEQPWSLP